MYPGGVGQSAPLYEMTDGLLRDTAELLARCPCGDGCPSCVGPAGEVGERGKHAAQLILAALRGEILTTSPQRRGDAEIQHEASRG